MLLPIKAGLRRPAELATFVFIIICFLLAFNVLNQSPTTTNGNSAPEPPLVHQNEPQTPNKLPDHNEPHKPAENHQQEQAAQASTSSTSVASTSTIQSAPSATTADCSHFKGIEDIHVIMRTGATELDRKVPVHLKTTFSCIPDFQIYSDLEQEFEGQHILDILDEMPAEIKSKEKNFKFYNKMKEYHTQGKAISNLAWEEGKPAWDLDKWKFLPLMTKVYERRPAAKFYAFIEADTYIVWPNLLKMLKNFDPEKPWYIGGQAFYNNENFAHGGTGFVLSNPAMKLLSEKWKTSQEELIKITQDNWAGDYVLADVSRKVGVPLSESWPNFQGETPFTLDYKEEIFCSPVVTFHHVPPNWVQKLYDFEQAWFRNATDDKPMLHKDVFDYFVRPGLTSKELEGYNNLAKDQEEKAIIPNTAAGCRAACVGRSSCLQYTFAEGKCKTANVIRLGTVEPPKGSELAVSGWMMERVNEFLKKNANCRNDFKKPKVEAKSN